MKSIRFLELVDEMRTKEFAGLSFQAFHAAKSLFTGSLSIVHRLFHFLRVGATQWTRLTHSPYLGPSACLLLLTSTALAFPPAPSHTIYGTARDEYGTPFLSPVIQIVLVTPGGVTLSTSINPGILPGVNYQLQVPMDAGLTPDPYMPNALPVAAPFKLYAIIGSITNLPIQMTGNFAQLGQPAQRTRLDLTLGADANGDGIPDAWEYAFLAAIGSNLSLSNLNANTDYTHDGFTLAQEFLLGNYPYNPGGSLTVRLVSVNGGSPLLEFTTMTGRSYTVLGSADLKQWMPLSFTVPAEGPNPATHSFYLASDIRTLQVSAITSSAGGNMQVVLPASPGSKFYRLAQLSAGASLAQAPLLSIVRTATNSVVVSWPATASTWTLQESTKISAGTWNTVSASPSQTQQGGVPLHFFRLMLQ